MLVLIHTSNLWTGPSYIRCRTCNQSSSKSIYYNWAHRTIKIYVWPPNKTMLLYQVRKQQSPHWCNQNGHMNSQHPLINMATATVVCSKAVDITHTISCTIFSSVCFMNFARKESPEYTEANTLNFISS